MTRVLVLGGPQDVELQDEIEGLTDKVVDDALVQQRANLEILRQQEEVKEQQQAVGAAALNAATDAPDAATPEAPSTETPGPEASSPGEATFGDPDF